MWSSCCWWSCEWECLTFKNILELYLECDHYVVGGHASETVGGRRRENAQTTFPHTSVMFYRSGETPNAFQYIHICIAIYLYVTISFSAHIGIIDFIFINVVTQHTHRTGSQYIHMCVSKPRYIFHPIILFHSRSYILKVRVLGVCTTIFAFSSINIC